MTRFPLQIQREAQASLFSWCSAIIQFSVIALLLFDGTLLCGDVRVTLPGNTHSVAGAPMVKLVDTADLKSAAS